MTNARRRLRLLSRLWVLACVVALGSSFGVPSVAAAAPSAAANLNLAPRGKSKASASGNAKAGGKRARGKDKPPDPEKQKPWIKRWAPTRNLVELGLFGGLFFASENHDFYDPITRPAKPLFAGSADVGLRLAYFPLKFLGLELEYSAVPTRARTQTDPFVFLYGFRGHAILQLPWYRVTPFLLGGYGLMGVRSASVVLGNDIDPMGHYGGGVKLFINRWLAVRLEARHLIAAKAAEQRDATNHAQLLAGLSFTLNRPKPKKIAIVPPPDPDRDKDGILNKDDQCPDTPGVAPHGCPDSDGDGFFDSVDKCPEIPGVAPDGCPAKDTDGDGIFDNDDDCVNDPETFNGFEDEDGCPDELPKKVKEFTGVIPGIKFEFNSDKIKPGSKPTLDKAIEVLKEYEDIKVEIVGHTDNVGTPEYNQELSEKRADAVRKYLVDGGVDEDRIKTRGMGDKEPVGSNDTEQGRAQNRRIEFNPITNKPKGAKGAGTKGTSGGSDKGKPAADKASDLKPVRDAKSGQ